MRTRVELLSSLHLQKLGFEAISCLPSRTARADTASRKDEAYTRTPCVNVFGFLRDIRQ
jgi:hypothetical protein